MNAINITFENHTLAARGLPNPDKISMLRRLPYVNKQNKIVLVEIVIDK